MKFIKDKQNKDKMKVEIGKNSRDNVLERNKDNVLDEHGDTYFGNGKLGKEINMKRDSLDDDH